MAENPATQIILADFRRKAFIAADLAIGGG